jgi:hypothetical protein
MGIAAAQTPELLTEAPRLLDALRIGQFYPEFEIVPIGFSGRCVPPHGHPCGARLAMRGHVDYRSFASVCEGTDWPYGSDRFTFVSLVSFVLVERHSAHIELSLTREAGAGERARQLLLRHIIDDRGRADCRWQDEVQPPGHHLLVVRDRLEDLGGR